MLCRRVDVRACVGAASSSFASSLDCLCADLAVNNRSLEWTWRSARVPPTNVRQVRKLLVLAQARVQGVQSPEEARFRWAQDPHRARGDHAERQCSTGRPCSTSRQPSASAQPACLLDRGLRWPRFRQERVATAPRWLSLRCPTTASNWRMTYGCVPRQRALPCCDVVVTGGCLPFRNKGCWRIGSLWISWLV
jgi:hypothetical protein